MGLLLNLISVDGKVGEELYYIIQYYTINV